jgi:hypothetical protein
MLKSTSRRPPERGPGCEADDASYGRLSRPSRRCASGPRSTPASAATTVLHSSCIVPIATSDACPVCDPRFVQVQPRPSMLEQMQGRRHRDHSRQQDNVMPGCAPRRIPARASSPGRTPSPARPPLAGAFHGKMPEPATNAELFPSPPVERHQGARGFTREAWGQEENGIRDELRRRRHPRGDLGTRAQGRYGEVAQEPMPDRFRELLGAARGCGGARQTNCAMSHPAWLTRPPRDR